MRTRRFRSDQRPQGEQEQEQDQELQQEQEHGLARRELHGVGKRPAATREPSPSPPTRVIAAVFGGLAATTVALKLHKFYLLGGAPVSLGAAAVVAEDLVAFVALFGLWHFSRRALFSLLLAGLRGGGGGGAGGGNRCRAVMARHRVALLRLATAVHWLALSTLAMAILVFVGVEHLYFYSTRVVQCCQECGVGGLVFVSSSRVVSSRSGLDLSDENVPFVTSQEDETAHAIFLAEAEVLKASETQNIGGSSCLYTCALRPAAIYGTKEDRSLQRALGWVGWGLNRVALGRENVQSDMLYVDNLVEAQVLAGRKLMEGAADAQAGGAGWSTHAPVCSGQAYFVTDGRPCNLQAFADGVLDGLDFSTSKIVRVPKMVALATAGVAELACKIGLTRTPVWTRKEVRTLTEDRTSSIARIRTDLGYEPIVDPGTALRSTVEGLKEAGWGRHTFLVPGLGYCILIPFFMWFLLIASFDCACPAFLAPVQRASLYIHLAVFRRLVLVRVTLFAAVLAHVLEGLYAYTRAQRAGHKDTAPRWLIQTTIIGFPSTRLVMRLLS